MNKDHMDAIHGYLKNYTDIKDFQEVELCEITSTCMKIKYDGNFTEINFPKEITEQEIKSTLVSMIL
jgi:hypothetical protein|tara:strand:- start:649 stop:849 length:201 start_codon:yes stop_codon:yes gene_type:complete